MLNTLKENCRLLNRFFGIRLENFKKNLFNFHLNYHRKPNQKTTKLNEPSIYNFQSKATPMSFSKALILFISKTVAFLVLANFFLINPIKQSLNNASEGFNQNPLIKIIGLDLIRNPITFIRMGNYYLDKGKLDQAELFIRYAEILKSQYPYPKELTNDLNALKEAVSRDRKTNPN
jgi:hypothetical protein